MLAHLLALLR
jgi:hypothetical protein